MVQFRSSTLVLPFSLLVTSLLQSGTLMKPTLTKSDTTFYLTTTSRNSATLEVSKMNLLPLNTLLDLKQIPINLLHQSTGSLLVMLVQLRIKVNAAHAGLFQQPPLLNHLSQLIMVLPLNNTQSNNLSPVHQLTEMQVATVVGTTGLGTTKSPTHKNSNQLTHTLQVQMELMVIATMIHLLLSQKLTQQPPTFKLVKPTMRSWLLFKSSQSQLLLTPQKPHSNHTHQVWSQQAVE